MNERRKQWRFSWWWGMAVLLAVTAFAPPASAAWRATPTTITFFYCGPDARMERLNEVLRWKSNGFHIIWRVTLETALDTILVTNSAACNSDGRTEAMWTMDRTEGEALIVPYLEERGIDTTGMSNATLANNFSAEFKSDLLKWEAEYNAFLATAAAPAPAAVGDLEEP